MTQYKLYPLNTSEEKKGKEVRKKNQKTNDIKINSRLNDQVEKVDQESPKNRFRKKLVGEEMKFPKP